MGQLWRAFGNVIPFFLAIIPVVILLGWFIYFKRVKKGEEKKKALYESSTRILLILSIIGVLLVTLLHRPMGVGRTIQLIPFLSMWNVLVNSVHYTVPIRILGFNIVLFIPFGFFLALVIQSRFKVIKITLIGMLFSFGIEISQYILANGRTSSINDVILNTFGAFIGALLGSYIAKRFLKSNKSL